MILVSLKIMVRKYSSEIYSSSFNNLPVLARFVEPVGRCALALQLAIGVWQQTAPAIRMLTTDKSFGAAICQFNGLSSLVLIKQQLLCMIPEKIMVYLKLSCLVLSCTWWRYPQLAFQRSAGALSAVSYTKFVCSKVPVGVWMSFNLTVKCRLSIAAVPWAGRAPSPDCGSRCVSSQKCVGWEILHPSAEGLWEWGTGSLLITGSNWLLLSEGAPNVKTKRQSLS